MSCVPTLYGEFFQTYNCHGFLHLAEELNHLGPLWASNCFYYDYNGDLSQIFHGSQSKSIALQVLTAVTVQLQNF